jgi:hypothetical protein
MWSTNAYDRRPRERPKSVMNQAGRAAKDFGGPTGFNVQKWLVDTGKGMYQKRKSTFLPER